MNDELQGELEKERPTPMAATSRYLEMVYPTDNHELLHDHLPAYVGGHLLHMLAMGPRGIEDVASHLGMGRAAAAEVLQEHLDAGLVLETAGLYSTSVPGVLNALLELWPKARWQHERFCRDHSDWDCQVCILPGDR